MSVIQQIQARGHEHVSIVQAPEVGLTAVIAVHNTVVGPALGGCRMRMYANLDEAVGDVLRLSEAMTYKNSLCGINFGGGKSVIIAKRELAEGRRELFQKFGAAIQALGGRYITAEDVGTSVSDIEIIKTVTSFVAGTDPSCGGAGDPSPFTALGVFEGMRACLERVFGSGDCAGRHVAVQGVGNVGGGLVKLLIKAGAKVSVSDTRESALANISSKYSVQVVQPEEIVTLPCDVFAPCAFGGVVTAENVNKLKCQIIAGGANNQLEHDGLETVLKEKGIIYAPDFAINAGGVILCADEFEPGGYNESRVTERVKRIHSTVGRILDHAANTAKTTGQIAVELAKERIEKTKQDRASH